MRLIKIIIAVNIVLHAACISQIKQFPVPEGKYPVGTVYLSFTDSTRYDPFIDEGSQYRVITAKAWYPAEKNPNIDYEKYFGENKTVQKILNISKDVFNIKSHSKYNLKILKKDIKYPVLIFNHGWGEHFLQNTILMEELASNGYIVISLAHHYECKFSIFPDNKLFILDPSFNSSRFKKIISEQTNPDAMNVFGKMFTARNYEDQDFIFKKANELLPTFFIESPRLWSEDIKYILDKLGYLNKYRFDGMLDLNKIGVLGMSMGGIAAQQICTEDNRIKAGISMDGGFYGDSYNRKISMPFMFISSYRYVGYEKYFLDHLTGTGYFITIPASDHYNFHDISIMDPSHPMLGKIDGERFLKILNKLVLGFFDEQFKTEKPLQKDEITKNFPEINFYSK